MGFALAEECASRGAQVTLISGPVTVKASHHRINVVPVESCLQMYDAAIEAFTGCDAAILCAAVADYRPATVAPKKIKRTADNMEIKLVPNPDIAAQLGQMKRQGQVLVGFALETDDEQHNATKKLSAKNLDFIVLNSLRNEGTCFRSDDNQISIISADSRKDFGKKSKQEVAKDIVDELNNYFNL